MSDFFFKFVLLNVPSLCCSSTLVTSKISIRYITYTADINQKFPLCYDFVVFVVLTVSLISLISPILLSLWKIERNRKEIEKRQNRNTTGITILIVAVIRFFVYLLWLDGTTLSFCVSLNCCLAQIPFLSHALNTKF